MPAAATSLHFLKPESMPKKQLQQHSSIQQHMSKIVLNSFHGGFVIMMFVLCFWNWFCKIFAAEILSTFSRQELAPTPWQSPGQGSGDLFVGVADEFYRTAANAPK